MSLDAHGIVLIDNDTYALELSKNWYSSSLELNRTQRPANATPMNAQALWFDEKRNWIFCFGGYTRDSTPFESIWAFKLDRRGSGNWEEVLGPTGIQAFPSNILRPHIGGLCNDESSGCYFGGYLHSWSSRFITDNKIHTSHGLLTFRFNDFHLTNTSDGDYERPLHWPKIKGSGKTANIPKFGTGGVIILLVECDPTQVITFHNITIYDKTEQKWHSQRASGTLPEPRSGYCIVGIRGTTASDNFEI